MKNKSTTLLVIAATVFLTVASFFVYSVLEVGRQGERFSNAKQLISEHAAKENAFNKVESLLASTKSDRDKINSYFIKESDTINFISSIESAASQIGVDLKTNELSIEKAVADDPLSTDKLSVGFTFSGSENQVKKFINFIENIPYHKSITSLDLVKEDSQTWKSTVLIELTLKI